MTSIFQDFDAFSAEFNQTDTHWAIDVYSPPEQGYLDALNFACRLQTRGYQLGKISIAAREAFATTFGGDKYADVATYFCPTGTAANALTRFTMLDQNKSLIVYSPLSHSVDREAGSVESLTGSRVLKPSDLFEADEIQAFKNTHNGYIPASAFKEALERREYFYLNQKPHVFSISVPSESGVIPSLEYIREIAEFTASNDMMLHLDGARLFVAAGATGKTLKEMTTDCGVDVVTLGGSKVGMIGAEAVVFTPNFFAKYPHRHHYNNATDTFHTLRANLKLIGGLSGRSEEISAQFLRALTDDYGINVGKRAHENAKLLATALKDVSGIQLESAVETNVVLLRITKKARDLIMQYYPYLKEMNTSTTEECVIRFMASHATQPHHISEAAAQLKQAGIQCPL